MEALSKDPKFLGRARCSLFSIGSGHRLENIDLVPDILNLLLWYKPPTLIVAIPESVVFEGKPSVTIWHDHRSKPRGMDAV